MKNVWKAGLVIGALAFASLATAEDAVAPAAPAADAAAVAAPADAAAPGAVEVSATGSQVVTVNSGNETVDAAANLAARCVEKAAAMQACGGGFKGIACKKGLEITRFKGLECPGQ